MLRINNERRLSNLKGDKNEKKVDFRSVSWSNGPFGRIFSFCLSGGSHAQGKGGGWRTRCGRREASS